MKYRRLSADELKELERDFIDFLASNQVTASGAPMCSAAGSNRSLPNQLDIDQSRVMALELEAMQAQMQGDLI